MTGTRVWNFVERATTLGVLLSAGVFLWNYRSSPRFEPGRSRTVAIPKAPVPLEGTSLGSSSAKIAMVEFSDFQCPYCSKFASETFPKLKAHYIDKGALRFVFRHNPIAIHTRAEAAAEAAECAGRQGRFWEMHDQLFQNPKRLEATDLSDYAQSVGLDVSAFRTCTATDGKEHVQRDVALAKNLNLQGTPMFLLGTIGSDNTVKVAEVIPGALPLPEFEATIDKLLVKGKAY